MNTCNNCHTETGLFFCPNCGKIIEYPDFVTHEERLKKALELFVMNMIAATKRSQYDLEEKVGKSGLAELVYRKYYQHIAYLQQLCSTDVSKKYFGGNGEALFEKMDQFAEKCKQNECQIAVVGTIKAGKSMLINAILGREIASTFPTPETASVTKFRSSNRGDYVKVSFYTDKEWQKLWNSVMMATKKSIRDDKEDFLSEYNSLHADEIKSEFINRESIEFKPTTFDELKQTVDKYTSSRHAEHYFAKEVEIGLSDFVAPANVVFVDTPGLNDPVSFRSNITRKYLHSANVILLCVKAASAELRSQELDEIASLFAELRYSKDRIYILGTQIDTPRNFKQYWDNHTKKEFLKYLSDDIYFGSEQDAKKQIFPVTAWYYNLVMRAKKNPEVWKDAEMKGNLEEMVRRCWKVESFEDLQEQYGTEEAIKRFKSPKQIFYEHISEFEDMTNIPQMRIMLMEGPVKASEMIIKNDVQSDYRYLCSQIVSTAKDVAKLRQETIAQSRAKDVQMQIIDLNQRISQSKREYAATRSALSELLKDLQDETNKVINKVRNK